MAKFMTRPKAVEAEFFASDQVLDRVIEWVERVSGGLAKAYRDGPFLSIDAPVEHLLVVPGEWVVYGEHGDFHLIDEALFDANYQEAD